MVKLKDYPFQKFPFKPCLGTYGIEIETEVEAATSYPEGFLNPKTSDSGHFVPELNSYVEYFNLWCKSWKGVLDGSLRNFGVEYIVKKPHTYEGIIHAIDEFAEYTKDIPFIENAPGTSVHVHINMQDEEILTIFTYITTWTLFENLLIEFCGEGRRTNLFALPSRVCEGNLTNYINLVDSYLNRTHAFSLSEHRQLRIHREIPQEFCHRASNDPTERRDRAVDVQHGPALYARPAHQVPVRRQRLFPAPFR